MSSTESSFSGPNAHHWEEQGRRGSSIETMAEELRAAIENYRQAARNLADVTQKVGTFIPEEVMTSADRALGTEYQELYELWVESPGDEALNLLGAQ